MPSCIPKELPADERLAAAFTACQRNPANRPNTNFMFAGFEPTPQRLAVLTTKYWGAKGVTLTVGFMDGAPADLRARILAHMNAWGNYCNAHFVLTQVDPQVRIARERDGYWSYLGTDILHIPKNRPTMNLEGFTMNTPQSEFIRVVRHETGHCFAGDTLIDCPRDLVKYPAGIPIKDLVGQQPWVYAWKDGKLVVRKASRVWLSRKAASVVRVVLKPGRGFHGKAYFPPQELVGTPEHRVMLSDGVTWKALGDLQPGDRLCSLYRSKNGPRSRIRWTGQCERIREHVFVCEQVYGQRPEHHDAHHKNENKLDQSPENLEWKEEHAHHSDHSSGRIDSAETRAKRVAANIGRKHTEATRARMAQAALSKPPMTEETKAKLSAASKGRPQSSELVAKRTAAMRRFYDSGGRSGMYGKKASEETRAKQSQSMRAAKRAKREAVANHIVVSVEQAGAQDVYDMTVPDAESFVANGVVVHNCLGFPHEHMRAEIIQRLDPQKTIAYFAQTHGWTPAMTTANVLTPLSETSLIATPHADTTSIMTYQLPGSITRDGRPIPGGDDIDEQDKAFCAKIYPLAIIPPVEPPTPPPPPVKPPEPPTVPSTLKDVIDAIFKALEAQLAGKPMLILITKTIHALVLQWLEQNPAQAMAPAPANASQLQTLVDQIFAALAEQFAGNFWMTMLIQTVHSLINQLLSDPAKAAAVIRTGSYGVST